MSMETPRAKNILPEQKAPRKPSKLPPIMTTSTTNLIRFQSDLKDHIKGEFKYQYIRNGTHIVTNEMADYSAMKSYLEENNLHYFTFSPNSKKPIKAVIRCLPPDLPTEDILNSLENLGFNVINNRQMMATKTAPNRQTHVEPLPLLLVTLTRNIKSQEIFKLNSLNFGHVWANCKQTPLYLWCSGGYLHREGPEKKNTESMPSSCNCTLGGEKRHPVSYQICSQVKGELQRIRAK
jgi:hypothetical protein